MRSICSQCACPNVGNFEPNCISGNEVSACVLCGCTRQHLRGLVAENGGAEMPVTAPKSEAKTGEQAHISAPTKSDFAPFLTAKELGKTGKATLTIVGVRDSASEFSDWIADVKCRGKMWAWGIKANGGNHRRLYAKYKAAWAGRKVQVEVKTHLGKKYIAVSD